MVCARRTGELAGQAPARRPAREEAISHLSWRPRNFSPCPNLQLHGNSPMCRVGLRKILLFLNAIHRSKGSAAKAKPRRGIVFRRGSGARTRKNGDASLPRANTHARTLATSCRLDPPLWNLKCQSGRPALSRLRHIIGVFLETALADSGVEDARKRPRSACRSTWSLWGQCSCLCNCLDPLRLERTLV